uniref:CBS domain-containing protein n=1 Tax=Ananas comosus var. bracteatus TaxID=296719 RepID=A0A6V7PUL4_ANACO|nr:unnamed protein product [Ananas comosus var. bracteatus]
MDLRKAEEEDDANSTTEAGGGEVDSSFALRSFLDRIPIASIPDLNLSSNFPELKPDDCVLDAINLMYKNNVSGAIIVENVDTDFQTFVNRHIGFIEFSSLVLWSLEEFGNVNAEYKISDHGFLSALEQTSQIARTKIGELAKLFLWEPFFPIYEHDSLFHASLLFSKHHRLNVIPVVNSSNPTVVGFVTQNAALQLLLQSSGLDWFDKIADKALSDFRFKDASRPIFIFSDQSLADVLHIMWEEQLDGVAVVGRKTGTLVGCVRRSDVYLLLEDDSIFGKRKTLTAEDFIKSSARTSDRSSSAEVESDRNTLCLKNEQLPEMTAPVSSRNTDSLKQAMQNLVASRSGCSFMVDESGHVKGFVTARDIISVFSPPCMDSRIDGGSFFSTALEQAGCHVEGGVIIEN